MCQSSSVKSHRCYIPKKAIHITHGIAVGVDTLLKNETKRLKKCYTVIMFKVLNNSAPKYGFGFIRKFLLGKWKSKRKWHRV